MGGLEPPADGLGGVGGGWEDLDDVQEKGLPLALGHGALRGVVVGVVGGAGEELAEGVESVLPPLPARPAYPVNSLFSNSIGSNRR